MKVEIIPIGLIGTNCYLVLDEANNDCIVIDPAFSRGKLTRLIDERKLNVLAVLLTHGHFDHCGGVKEVVGDKTIPVYCQVDDVELAAKASANRWGAPAYDCEVTHVIYTEQDIKIGTFNVKVLFTPGHTPGSVCYFIQDCMFSGDTLFCGDIGRTDLAGGCANTMQKSLQKISRIEKGYRVLPGHEEETTLSYEKEHNAYLRTKI